MVYGYGQFGSGLRFFNVAGRLYSWLFVPTLCYFILKVYITTYHSVPQVFVVFIGKPLNQRPRYQILGVFLLIQLCILGAEGLRRSNLSSIASSVHQTSLGSYQTSTGRGLPILNECGNLITDSSLSKGRWASDSAAASEVSHILLVAAPESQASGGTSKCTLCLSTLQHPTATLVVMYFAGIALWNGATGSLNAPYDVLRSPIQV